MRRRRFLQTAASVAAVSVSPWFGRRVRAQGRSVLRMGMEAEVLTLDPIKTVYGPDCPHESNAVHCPVLLSGQLMSVLARFTLTRNLIAKLA
jgi:hypothetical protein